MLRLAMIAASTAAMSDLLDLRSEKREAAAARLLVVYHSETGFTKTLAGVIQQGAISAGAEVRLLSCKNATYKKDVLWADAIVVGSPVHYGNPAADILAWFQNEWEDGFTDPALNGKVGSAFATGGGMNQGVEHVVTGLQRALESFRIQYVAPDPSRSGYHSYGSIAITGTPPFNLTAPQLSQQFIQPGKDLGKKVASAAAAAVAQRSKGEL
jgi:NAD(P)H dehydrogenase (quinone)